MRRAEIHALRGRLEEDGSITGDIDLDPGLTESQIVERGKESEPSLTQTSIRSRQACVALSRSLAALGLDSPRHAKRCDRESECARE